MNKKQPLILLFCLLMSSFGAAQAQKTLIFDKYHNHSEVQLALKELQQNNPELVRLHTIATSPGEEAIVVLEIGKNSAKSPAIFVGANFEGNIPLATEGAIALAKMLIDSSKYTLGLRWYILSLPNPDASKGYFAEKKYERSVNDFAINNDMDEAVNEDGYEDLNGDGLVTQMRVKDLTGAYIISKIDPRIMVQADAKKGERGIYKIYSEGIDNDKDGEYNEDGEGGINVGIGFPHLFPKNKKDAGLWPGQTPEVFGIMKFIYAHPDIAMAYTLGSSNFCLFPPKPGRKSGINTESLQIPNRYANMLGVDPSKTYKMDEVIEMVKTRFPNVKEVNSSYVSNLLGLGAAVNPLEDDLKFYVKFSEDYKKYLKTKRFSLETMDPAQDKDGSFELWAYYHLGVPSFSMNLFTVPKEKAKEEKGKEESKAEKVEALTEKEKALLGYSDKDFAGKGFVQWGKYNHPSLGEVEIGGFVPYLETTPKSERIDSLLKVQLPWLLQLSKYLPDISVVDQKITDLGAGVYRLELFIENKGSFAYPIAIGELNKQPAPVVIVLDGEIDLLQGLKRTPLGTIGGNQVKKLTWLMKTDKKPTIAVTLESLVFGSKVKQIKIGDKL